MAAAVEAGGGVIVREVWREGGSDMKGSAWCGFHSSNIGGAFVWCGHRFSSVCNLYSGYG